MGLDDIVRSGVAVADSLTQDLQVTVQHSAYAGIDGFGTPQMDAVAVARKALVELTQRPIVTSTGTTIMSRAKVTFLKPISPRGGVADRKEPIDPRDIIILPDGSTGPILAITGMLDAGTNKPFFAEVWLGA